MKYVVKMNYDSSINILPVTTETVELPMMNEAVGGYIEIVPVNKPFPILTYKGENFNPAMVANEEGLIKSLPVNPYAAQLVGNLLIVNRNQNAKGESEIIGFDNHAVMGILTDLLLMNEVFGKNRRKT